MIITTTEKLSQLCQTLSQASYITLDTEFIREKTYYPVLCLIQIATDNIAACIDPLSPDLDLSPLFSLLENPNIIKVFHAARQDIEIFYHLTQKVPAPLFDTQIAAMVCGYGENIGYQQLVQDITGTVLDKSLRFTDWSHRPLTEEQINYALHDVTYLRDVYKSLHQTLQKTERTSWLSEEIAIQNDPATYEVDNDTIWKKIKTPFKKPAQIHLFSRLCAWREQTAKEKNKPRRHILKDDALIELVATKPKTAEELSQLRHIPNGFENSQLGHEILEVITKAEADPSSAWPKDWAPPKQLTATQRTVQDLLQLLLSVIATDLGVAPKIIATHEDLAQLARGNNQVPCMTGWRREVFGEKVLLFKQGRLSIRYNPQTHKPEIIPDHPRK